MSLGVLCLLFLLLGSVTLWTWSLLRSVLSKGIVAVLTLMAVVCLVCISQAPHITPVDLHVEDLTVPATVVAISGLAAPPADTVLVPTGAHLSHRMLDLSPEVDVVYTYRGQNIHDVLHLDPVTATSLHAGAHIPLPLKVFTGYMFRGPHMQLDDLTRATCLQYRWQGHLLMGDAVVISPQFIRSIALGYGAPWPNHPDVYPVAFCRLLPAGSP